MLVAMGVHFVTRRKNLVYVWILLIICSLTTIALMQWMWLDKTRHLSYTTKADFKCTKPQQNIVFLKTHKTGSSTFTNVLNRFADENNLTVLLPKGKMYSFSWPNKLQFEKIGRLNSRPNILCNHARFNKVTLDILFPKENSKYVTILREPVAQYESVFYFFNFHYFTRHHGINEFLTAELSYEEWRRVKKRSPAFALSRNPLMFDLGFDFKFYENRTAINEYIRFLDQQFDLVMILKYFDESLVLLKRLFCWDIKDILYFKQVQRTGEDKNKEQLTNEVKRKIQRWNKADVMLYHYFNATLWRKIQLEGPEFYKDLKLFRRELRRAKTICLSKYPKRIQAYTGKFVMGYQLKNNIPVDMRSRCEKMLNSETYYVEYFRNKTAKVDEEGWDVRTNTDFNHGRGIKMIE